jgi:hypothetical protein
VLVATAGKNTTLRFIWCFLWTLVLLEKLTVAQLVKFSVFKADVHKRPLDRILSQTKTVHTLTPHLFKILFNIIFTSVRKSLN